MTDLQQHINGAGIPTDDDMQDLINLLCVQARILDGTEEQVQPATASTRALTESQDSQYTDDAEHTLADCKIYPGVCHKCDLAELIHFMWSDEFSIFEDEIEQASMLAFSLEIFDTSDIPELAPAA